jgi:hypothetical protein
VANGVAFAAARRHHLRCGRVRSFVTLMARNADYVIYITTRRGRRWSYLKQDDGWKQTAPNGRVHQMTAEQLLSHLLPPLAGVQPGLSVMVESRSSANERA